MEKIYKKNVMRYDIINTKLGYQPNLFGKYSSCILPMKEYSHIIQHDNLFSMCMQVIYILILLSTDYTCNACWNILFCPTFLCENL